MSDYGKLIINFEKRDYNVNVDLKTLEVDVNIERADNVDTYELSNIGVEWNQERWGYMIYPKNEEDLLKVLKVLKISLSKNELDKFMSAKKEKGGYMAKGGFIEYKFNSHKNHNPTTDILEGHLDKDSLITYGVYVKDTDKHKKGDEFMEYYSGENYKVGSSKKSSSRMYSADKIPSKYKNDWLTLKSKYEKEYK